MELTRVILLGALFILGFMLWTAWEHDYPAQPIPKTSVIKPVDTGIFQPAPTQTAAPATVPTTNLATTKTAANRFVTVNTDVLKVVIDTLGGNIVSAELLKYPQELHSPKPVQLLNNNSDQLYVAQSGLIGDKGPDNIKGQGQYTVSENNFSLLPGQNNLIVNLLWKNNDGVAVTKQFTFNRNDYQIYVNYLIDNKSKAPWTGQLYSQLSRKKPVATDHSFFAINPYVGGAISSPDKPYQKISFDKMAEKNLNLPITNGWAAMLEHYFISAWIPPTNQNFTYYTHASDNNVYILGFLGQPVTVQPGQNTNVGAKLYSGPAIMDKLKAAAPNLDLTIDYGILWFVSSAIFWLLKQIYNIVGNWGWSIVLVTVLIKLAFYHLSAKSYKSMAAMRKLQPKLQALKERYGDDRQKLTQETMELYKKEKINPLGGCLPIVVQIPVFIALYWVLLESVELRQAPFILWIHDLSVKDPYFILPIIMGLTMWIQQKLNPPPPDPMQAKMMNFLPIFFTFLFISFPAGLVLYWVVNNSLSILQQWYVMSKVDGKFEKKKSGTKNKTSLERSS